MSNTVNKVWLFIWSLHRGTFCCNTLIVRGHWDLKVRCNFDFVRATSFFEAVLRNNGGLSPVSEKGMLCFLSRSVCELQDFPLAIISSSYMIPSTCVTCGKAYEISGLRLEIVLACSRHLRCQLPADESSFQLHPYNLFSIRMIGKLHRLIIIIYSFALQVLSSVFSHFFLFFCTCFFFTWCKLSNSTNVNCLASVCHLEEVSFFYQYMNIHLSFFEWMRVNCICCL